MPLLHCAPDGAGCGFPQCKDIASSDWLSKSDPMVEMYMKKDKDSEYEQVGATEMQKDTYSPTFALKIECRYTFEVKQYCKVFNAKNQRIVSHKGQAILNTRNH